MAVHAAGAPAAGGGAGRDRRGGHRRQGGGTARCPDRRCCGPSPVLRRRHRVPADVRRPDPGRPSPRSGFRLRPGRHVDGRVCAHHRWHRSLAALPDARCRLDRPRRRLAAPRQRSIRARAARRLRHARLAGVRRAPEPVVLAVRDHHWRARLRRRGAGRREPRTAARLHPGDLPRVRHPTRDRHRRADRRRWTPCTDRPQAHPPPSSVRRHAHRSPNRPAGAPRPPQVAV